MPFLLELRQGDWQHCVGLFSSEANVLKFISHIPFVTKNVSDGMTEFTLNYDEIPLIHKINYSNQIYILSKYSFKPPRKGEVIELFWREVYDWDEYMPTAPVPCNEWIVVEGYSFAMNEAEAYINKREHLCSEVQKYYKKMGAKTQRGGTGSEDGEYVAVTLKGKSEPFLMISLDPSAVEMREASKDFAEFVRKYGEEV